MKARIPRQRVRPIMDGIFTNGSYSRHFSEKECFSDILEPLRVPKGTECYLFHVQDITFYRNLEMRAGFMRVAPSRSTEPLRATKVDRKGRPSGPETRFSTISGRFWDRFSSFFEAASRERLDSQREGPNPVLYWQAQYFQGFAELADKPKINRS